MCLLGTFSMTVVMHMALLLGYGVSAINPYLAFEILAAAAAQDDLDGSIGVAAAIWLAAALALTLAAAHVIEKVVEAPARHLLRSTTRPPAKAARRP